MIELNNILLWCEAMIELNNILLWCEAMIELNNILLWCEATITHSITTGVCCSALSLLEQVTFR
jgi:hypothetical protein